MCCHENSSHRKNHEPKVKCGSPAFLSLSIILDYFEILVILMSPIAEMPLGKDEKSGKVGRKFQDFHVCR